MVVDGFGDAIDDAGSEADLDRLRDGATVDLLLTDPPYDVRVEPRSSNAIAAGMSHQWDAAYAAWLANAPSGRKTLDAQGLHHSGFDVARGKTGVDRSRVRTTSSRPPPA